ncbi:hypothetical protein J6TS2_40750 [Heyndrickxia sporothermodurans]|nr:hypothetical protein J6TS2_40750 [Heyndrickxia sporothermodurans]
MAFVETIQPIATEIVKGANVEKTLAKYFGLSVTKDEVKNIKNALNKQEEIKLNAMIEELYNKRWSDKEQILKRLEQPRQANIL